MNGYLLVAAVAWSTPLAHAETANAAACAMPATRNIGTVYDTLSRRAVEIVERSSLPGWEKDAELGTLVAPDAEFSLGSGDVGRPLGQGVAGAHALAQAVKADSFRYLAWSAIPMEVDPCGEWSVKVEFIDSRTSALAAMEFKFSGGVLRSALGWSQWYVAGPLEPPATR